MVVTHLFMQPHLVATNARNRFASAKQMLRTYMRNPTAFGLLSKAYAVISPILSQLRKSNYIFVFLLPQPLSVFAGRMANSWFLRVLHRLAQRKRSFLIDTPAAEAMAASVGPGASECHPTPKTDMHQSYPESVARRIPSGGWYNKIRLYREGLFLKPWQKSLETLFALRNLEELEESSPRSKSASPHSAHRPSTAGLFDSGPPGALRSPATIVYGMKDLAFEPKLGLEGIQDYLVKGSQVVLVEKGGHWLPVEQEGGQVLEEVITWCLEEENGTTLKAWLAESCEKFGKRVKVTVEI
jgi:pimeloyl-ACP methyl ester carboxylesterase